MNKILYLIPLLLVIAIIPAFADETTIGTPDPDNTDPTNSGNSTTIGYIPVDIEVLEPVTVSLDNTQYNATSVIMVTGTVIKTTIERNGVHSQPYVNFKITNEDGIVFQTSKRITSGDGSYTKQIRPTNNIADWSATGIYTLTVTYAGNEAVIPFNYIGAPSLMVVPEYDSYGVGEKYVQIVAMGATPNAIVNLTVFNSSDNLVWIFPKESNSKGNVWFNFDVMPDWSPGLYKVVVQERYGSSDTTQIFLQITE